nr:Hypothetical protein A200_02880 [uncultured bacterium]
MGAGKGVDQDHQNEEGNKALRPKHAKETEQGGDGGQAQNLDALAAFIGERAPQIRPKNARDLHQGHQNRNLFGTHALMREKQADKGRENAYVTVVGEEEQSILESLRRQGTR